MLVTGIKSKPVYAPLAADTGGRYHLLVGFGPGAAATLRVAQELKSAAADALTRARVLLAPDAHADASSPGAMTFENLGVGRVQSFEGRASLLTAFRAILEESLMGTRLYVAGPESAIGLTMKIALEFNLNKDEIRAEEVGSRARRVWCVHCRAVSEGVTTNLVNCPGCARWLLVRDHYSRRLAAYMGVMVDAEAPGERPALEEIYR
jgi:hypothetical protein